MDGGSNTPKRPSHHRSSTVSEHRKHRDRAAKSKRRRSLRLAESEGEGEFEGDTEAIVERVLNESINSPLKHKARSKEIERVKKAPLPLITSSSIIPASSSPPTSSSLVSSALQSRSEKSPMKDHKSRSSPKRDKKASPSVSTSFSITQDGLQVTSTDIVDDKPVVE
eukprot:TRINITY_DN6654_c0_g1_i1.p1 TRINITY_DN6654_c0_g1~~TRINITY_DN6654_c0_g1_i1.p1  ORF type:complete len:176 (-),score=47.80 TRINITY_DN6654_c0_g1_i1:179-679(-)